MTEQHSKWLYHPKGRGTEETQLVTVLAWLESGATVLGEEPGTLSMFAPEFVKIRDLTVVPDDTEPVRR